MSFLRGIGGNPPRPAVQSGSPYQSVPGGDPRYGQQPPARGSGSEWSGSPYMGANAGYSDNYGGGRYSEKPAAQCVILLSFVNVERRGADDNHWLEIEASSSL